MSITIRDGGASVTLTGDLAAWAERAIRKGAGAAADVIRAEMQGVADVAEAEWYGPQGVQRKTGKSGTMAVRTTIDASRGVVKFSVGSTDDRTRPGGMPVPNAVHRRGPLAKRPGDGKKLLPLFVNSPTRKAMQAATQRIAAAMAKGATDAR